MTEDRDLLAAFTRAVRKADRNFQTSGGSSRHWVRECWLPAIDGEGLSVVPSDRIRTLQARVRKLEGALEALRIQTCACDFQEKDEDCTACSIARAALGKAVGE